MSSGKFKKKGEKPFITVSRLWVRKGCRKAESADGERAAVSMLASCIKRGPREEKGSCTKLFEMLEGIKDLKGSATL